MMNIINLIELLLLVVCFIGLLIQIAKNRAISARVEDYQDDLACAIADHSERLETVERVAGECCNRIQPLITTLDRIQIKRDKDGGTHIMHLRPVRVDGVTIKLYNNTGRLVGSLSEEYVRRYLAIKPENISRYVVGITVEKDEKQPRNINTKAKNDEANDTADGREG